MTSRIVALGLSEVVDPPDEIRLGIGHERVDGKAPFTSRDDVRAPVGERRDRDDPRFGADPVGHGGRSDLGAGPDKNDAEGTLALDRAADEEPVPRLEDVQRQERPGEQNGAEREQRQQFAHATERYSGARAKRSTRAGARPAVISVVLHGELQQFGAKRREVDGAGKSAREIVTSLGIPAAETAAYVVNGEQVDDAAVLQDGDTLELLPAMTGGESEGALAGIRVVDLTWALAGPYCTLMLADHGADVVKVEIPGVGDESREWAPPHIKGVSAYYLAVNRNKRSVTSDLKHPDGKRILERLVEKADVVVENFSPGVLARLGFPDERLRSMNRRAVICHISGFGQDGPGRAWAAYDLVVQGMGGIMSLTGEPGREPVMVGVPQADMVGGMFAAFAIVAALEARHRTGEGQVIDATMIGGQVALLSRQAARYFADGTVPRPEGNMHASIVPYQTFRAADGFVNVCCANNALFERLCRALDLEDLLEDSRFADNPSRVKHRDALVPRIEARIATLPKAEVVRKLREANVPVGPISDLREVFSDPVVRHLGLIAEVDHPVAGRFKAPGIPVRLSGTPGSVRRYPPLLGEHTDEVLAEIGYSLDEIAKLRTDGAI